MTHADVMHGSLTMPEQLLRFADLKDCGLVDNHTTLQHWIAAYGFPRGRWLSPNQHVWTRSEIEKWLAARPQERPSRQRRSRSTTSASADTSP